MTAVKNQGHVSYFYFLVSLFFLEKRAHFVSANVAVDKKP